MIPLFKSTVYAHRPAVFVPAGRGLPLSPYEQGHHYADPSFACGYEPPQGVTVLHVNLRLYKEKTVCIAMW